MQEFWKVSDFERHSLRSYPRHACTQNRWSNIRSCQNKRVDNKLQRSRLINFPV